MLVPSSIFRSTPAQPSLREIAVLGGSGSIGTTTLEILKMFPSHFRLSLISVHQNIATLQRIIAEYSPKEAVITGMHSSELGHTFLDTKIFYGEDALNEKIKKSTASVVVAGIVGIAGLPSTIAALQAGKLVALANKESVVCGAALIKAAIDEGKGTLIPIDSEHASLFQCLLGKSREEISSLVLTASGGPFFHRRRDELTHVTPTEAVKHPQWSMGAKVSVDSATMMNKALEVIEAHFLFGGIPVEVVIHPQSFIHGGVKLIDGSILLHAGFPHMRAPIGFGLAYPERLPGLITAVNVATPPEVKLHQVDEKRFPAIALAQSVLTGANGMTTVLNAANEAAVQAFLEGNLPFTQIESVVEAAVLHFDGSQTTSLEDLKRLDGEVRELCTTFFHRSPRA